MATQPNLYDIGDVVRVTGIFTDLNGFRIDPTTVTFKFKSPSAQTTTYLYLTDAQLVKESTGKYHVDIPVTEPGSWYYRWSSTGTGLAGAEEGAIVVREQTFV